MPAKAKAKPSAAKKPAARERLTKAPRSPKPTASLRQPSAPRTVDDFVAHESKGAHLAKGVASARAEATPLAPSSRSGSFVTRKDGSERKRTTVYFEPELARRLNIHCATHDLEMSQVVGEAVEALLSQKR